MTIDHAPRYEYRVWGRALDDIAARIRSESDRIRQKESDETYLVPHTFSGVNAKLRAKGLDAKILLREQDGFEQWIPDLAGTFPLEAAWIRDRFFPLIGLDPPPIEADEYSLDGFLSRVISPTAGITSVPVSKQREFFTVNGCIAEIAGVEVSGIPVQTIAIESTDLDALRTAQWTTGVGALPNMSYARGIPWLLGWDSREPPTEVVTPHG